MTSYPIAPDQVTEILAHKLRLLRDAHHMSQAELARLMGQHVEVEMPWGRSTVSDVERGTRNLRPYELVALTLIFDCTVQDLFSPVWMPPKHCPTCKQLWPEDADS